jgi:LytS/YehU family sensor histidine kinase
MDTICNDVCVLVTAAFALTLIRGFKQPERRFLQPRDPSSRHDQSMALLVFLVLGLVEELTLAHARWFNERIVAVCAAGLVAGPWVGLAVSAFVTWLAVARHGLPLGSIAISMLCGGLAGGWLYRWRPRLAQHPLTGFCLTFAVSLLRNGLTFFYPPNAHPAPQRLEEFGMAPVLQGLGTALILAVVEQVRNRDEQTRAVASAEVRALQARMNPHFLFKIRAVIIEDEPLAAQHLAELLDETCQVDVVGSATESEAGLRLCAELQPDAVFVDINLPGKDGVSLATQLAMLPQPPRWSLRREPRTAPSTPSGWRR